jgi:hypothetical protein
VRNKGEEAVFEELAEIRRRLPFPLLGLDSDNGGEFINRTLVHYCEEESITLTRARPYRKNDSCHVEQKTSSEPSAWASTPSFCGTRATWNVRSGSYKGTDWTFARRT